MAKNRVRVRFAPSPTGSLHIGGLRTALYNFLFAKQNGGDFILRIEDTDQTRKVEGAFEELVHALHTFGLHPDEGPSLQDDGTIEQFGSYGPYVQSERTAIYLQVVEKLIANDFAYRSFDTEEDLQRMREIQKRKGLPPRYDGKDRDISHAESDRRVEAGEQFTVRLKLPKTGVCEFEDMVRGKVSFSYKEIDDQVLLKSDGFPTYHLANVVDDHEMNISHVIRGEEWLPSVPKHLFLYEALGWEPPKMAHLPILLDKNGGKLSKRSGAASVNDFLSKGFLPDAILNFLLLLGWNPKTEKEIFSREEMISFFSLEEVHSSGAIVNLDKLMWMNKEYMRSTSSKDVFEYALKQGLFPEQWKTKASGGDWFEFFELVKERLGTLEGLADHVEYFFQEPQYEGKLLVQKNETAAGVAKKLQSIIALLKDCTPWNGAHAKDVLEAWMTKENYKRGEVLWPIRVALSGKKFSPGAYELLDIFPKDTVLLRLTAAKEKLD